MTAVAQTSDAALEVATDCPMCFGPLAAERAFWSSTQHQISCDAIHYRISHFNAQAVSVVTNIKQLVICVSAENIHGARCLQKC